MTGCAIIWFPDVLALFGHRYLIWPILIGETWLIIGIGRMAYHAGKHSRVARFGRGYGGMMMMYLMIYTPIGILRLGFTVADANNNLIRSVGVLVVWPLIRESGHTVLRRIARQIAGAQPETATIAYALFHIFSALVSRFI